MNSIVCALVEQALCTALDYAEKNLAGNKLIITNAEGKSAKQISDIESLEVQGMKVLMISPQDGAAVIPTIKGLMAKGIKVVTLEIPAGEVDSIFGREQSE